MAFQTILKVYVGFPSFPAACTPGTGYRHQYAYWWRYLYIGSVRHPEIPQDFRRTQAFPLCIEKSVEFFDALKGLHGL